MANAKIGITERGDAGIDFSWREKLATVNNRAVLITKRLSEKFCDAVLEETAKGAKLIVHATITGFGGTVIEPNVLQPAECLKNLRSLIDKGFPAERIVLRIDPIIPGYENYAKDTLDKALQLGILPAVTCKVSVMDGYRHVHERFKAIGVQLPFTGFAPDQAVFDKINALLGYYKTNYNIRFTSCAERRLTNAEPAGCIDKHVCEILDVSFEYQGVNPQNRGDCLCLNGIKTELLTQKKRCPHQCAYCYWRD